ncbi:MAG: amidohydrolase [Candidatus Schekmanbacteria bacterium]|nr:amidohydrolase [Candidatus Schekmanbacteria bacterium]
MKSLSRSVVDFHLHLITRATLVGRELQAPPHKRHLLAKDDERHRRHVSRIGNAPMQVVDEPIETTASRWVAELDSAGVDVGTFYVTGGNRNDVLALVSKAPRRIVGFTWIDDPCGPGAVSQLERDVADGFAGVKLYPPLQLYHAYDERAYPLYEKIQELCLPVVFHMGVSIGYLTDLRYANPTDLQPVARDFPEMPVVMAHFGTGYMREALFTAYHCHNVMFDTSSSNIWREFLPARPSLRDVFAQFLDAVGAHRILFGSDSSYFPRGYRRDLLAEQTEILHQLGISDDDMAAIMGGNARRLLARSDLELSGSGERDSHLQSGDIEK